jgi:MATE family multidrug resistance protein
MSSHADQAAGRKASPLGELLLLALPTVAQMTSYTVMQFTDTYMLSRVGDLEAAAAGQAGMFVFSFMSFGVGVLYLVNTLVSQSFGRGDYLRCGQFLWQGLWFGLLLGMLVLPVLPFAGSTFRALGHEPSLVALETRYAWITLSFAAAKLFAVAMGQFLLAISRPNIVLVAAVAGCVVNVVVNWLLIYGNMRFPKLGVAGAAWGTNAALVAELIVLAWVIFRDPVRRSFNTLDWQFRRSELLLLLRTGVPAGLQIVAEVMAWTLFSIGVMAAFGTTGLAASNYMFRYMMVSFMPAHGLGHAVTALVGRYIGMGKPEVAVQRAHLGFLLAGVYMVACGVLMVVFREPMMRLFSSDSAVIEAGKVLLVWCAIYQILDALYVIYNGALRGAGDTLVPAVVLGVLVWVVTVFGGWAIARYLPGWGVGGPWFAATCYGTVLGVWLMLRFVAGHWKSIRLEPDRKESDDVPNVLVGDARLQEAT